MSEKSDERSKRVRSSIQASIDQAHEEHKRELFRRRIELARTGVRNYEIRKHGDAVKAFHTYLKILEDWKGVPESGLRPSHFDTQKDMPELLLLTGVFWDLAKLYDRTKTPERQKDFRHYLEMYVQFSKGMPHQGLSGETLRKYIRNEKPLHRDEFKNAYKALTGSNCFIATSLMDLIEDSTLESLREYRDLELSRTQTGRIAIGLYYKAGPALAAVLNRSPKLIRKWSALVLDQLARLAQNRTNATRPKDELAVRDIDPKR